MRINSSSIILAVTFSVSLPALAAATATAAAAGNGGAYTVVEGISEYRLANGLRVLLAPDASKPTTTINVTYLVGSRHESYGETGMAHLLEHLVFKGTPDRGNILQELGKRGMRFNGTTFFDRTNYFETFPSNQDNLTWALQMEADRMVHSRIARSDLESEFSVVRNEMEIGESNPVMALSKQLEAVSFDWHNYGHDTIGARSDVEGVHIENLQNFYRTYYQPDNAVLMVAGKFDPQTTLASIRQVFGAIPKPERQLKASWTREAQRDGMREVTVNRVGDIQLAALLYLSAAGSHVDSAPMAVLSRALGDPKHGRLYRNMVDRKLAVGVQSMNFALAEPGYVMFMAQLSKDQKVADARQALIDTVEGLARAPVTEQELKLAKTSILNEIDKTLNDPQRLCVAMSDYIAQGDWRLFFL